MRRSISRIFTELAAADPSRVVLVDGEGAMTALELERAANRLAHALAERGVRRDDLVTITLPNARAFVVAAAAVWKAGATPQPVAFSRTAGQRAAIARVAGAVAAIGAPPGIAGIPVISDPLQPGAQHPSTPPVEQWASSWKAPTSSGSTGVPKVVRAAGPALFDPTRPVAPFLPLEAVHLVSGPLSHSAVFTYAMRGLMTGHRLIVLPRFDERAWLDAVERHGVTWALLVPTMMHRLLRLDPALRGAERVRSLRAVLHMGAACAPALKRAFLEWLGPERVLEVYAGSESNGLTLVGGAEWLRHPGTVGRPIGGTEIEIRGETGEAMRAGETGEVWMRRGDAAAYRYVGAESRRDENGWDTLGDLGRLDEDGRLYLLDRADDVISRGGEKIHPAEVEAVLEQHPDVRGAIVCGVPDAEWGARVGAVVDIAEAAVETAELRAWARERLDAARCPELWRLERTPVRDDAGKTSRRSWAELFSGAAKGRGSNP